MTKPGPKPKIRLQPIDSHEWQEWHLTQTGWVEGRQKLDCMPKLWDIPNARGRLLTCRVGDSIDTVFDAPQFYIREVYRNRKQPKVLLKALREHGRWPPDFRAEILVKYRSDWLTDLLPAEDRNAE